FPHRVAGLAVGHQGLHFPLSVARGEGDIAAVLPSHAADAAGACLGERRGGHSGSHAPTLLPPGAGAVAPSMRPAAYGVFIDEAALNRLLAIEEIKQLKARYFRCLDTKDWAGLTTVFTPDAVLEAEGRVREGREAIVATIAKVLEGAVSVHDGHRPEITTSAPAA